MNNNNIINIHNNNINNINNIRYKYGRVIYVPV